MKAPFNDNNGDGNGGSSCTGYNPGGFTAHHVAFNIQHGSTGAGGKKDAYQNCHLWVKLKRKNIEKIRLPDVQKKFHWLQDVDFPLDPNLKSYDLVMRLYTGQAFTITSRQQVPYSLFEILPDNKNIKVRPRAQREF